MLVNIGLHVGDGRETIHPTRALAALRSIGGAHVRRWSTHTSDSEPTLVADIDALPGSAAYAVAEYLKQDAVALWDGHNGSLIGPRAAAWGAFDPAYFMGLDGNAVVRRKVAAR